MTDLNRRAAGLGEYGDEPNDNGSTPDDAPESPETDQEPGDGESPPVAPAVQPADQGGGGG